MTQHKYKLFGRFKGRKKIKIISNYNYTKYNVNFQQSINKMNYNILDIGSGSGENAIYLSMLNPTSQIFTCELFEDGNINLINTINDKQFNNIHLFKGNVLEFFDKIKTNQVFDQIWILFPDPWPKKRHYKRRLINYNFLKLIYLYLKDDGRLMVASDSQSYIQSILSTIHSVQKFFIWENQGVLKWDYQKLQLPETKFYKKAKKSNRNSIFFQLKKI